MKEYCEIENDVDACNKIRHCEKMKWPKTSIELDWMRTKSGITADYMKNHPDVKMI